MRGGKGAPRVGVDWLTVTAGLEGCQLLEGWSLADGAGSSQAGFRGSERRLTLGGFAWRKQGPVSPSKRWGLEYESWEWSGGQGAKYAALFLRGRTSDIRPSRADVCFDFEVPGGLTSDVVAAAIRPHLLAHRITPEAYIKGDDNTHYAGSRSSLCRVKIYRKDLKDEAWLFDRGPTLRIEVSFKKEWAERWWLSWERDEAEAYRVAAHRIHQMTGMRVLAEMAEPRTLEVPSFESEKAQLLLQFLDQNASMLAIADEVGVDLAELARHRLASSSRETHWRHKRKLREFQQANAALLRDRVLALMLNREEAVA